MTEQAYKTCCKCGCTSLEVDFYATAAYCKSCHAASRAVVYQLQKSHPYPVDHRCDICGKGEDELPVSFGRYKTRKRPWRLDHCHETGEFRGFLCDNCNTGLGKFKDEPEILLNAIAYLQGHKQKSSH